MPLLPAPLMAVPALVFLSALSAAAALLLLLSLMTMMLLRAGRPVDLFGSIGYVGRATCAVPANSPERF